MKLVIGLTFLAFGLLVWLIPGETVGPLFAFTSTMSGVTAGIWLCRWFDDWFNNF
jgi:hypothetical protein